MGAVHSESTKDPDLQEQYQNVEQYFKVAKVRDERETELDTATFTSTNKPKYLSPGRLVKVSGFNFLPVFFASRLSIAQLILESGSSSALRIRNYTSH